MDYRKNNLYRVGLFVFGVGTADVAVTATLMALGRDSAILWFFLGCFVMIIGNSIMVLVKYKYQQRGEDESTFGEKVSWRVYDIKEFFTKKGVLGTVMFFALITSVVISAVFCVRAAKLAYSYSGSFNAGYEYNLQQYEKNINLAAQIRDESVTLAAEGKVAEANQKQREAERYELLANDHLYESGEYYKTALKLKPLRDAARVRMYVALGFNLLVLALYSAELIIRKNRRGKRN